MAEFDGFLMQFLAVSSHRQCQWSLYTICPLKWHTTFGTLNVGIARCSFSQSAPTLWKDFLSIHALPRHRND